MNFRGLDEADGQLTPALEYPAVPTVDSDLLTSHHALKSLVQEPEVLVIILQDHRQHLIEQRYQIFLGKLQDQSDNFFYEVNVSFQAQNNCVEHSLGCSKSVVDQLEHSFLLHDLAEVCVEPAAESRDLPVPAHQP